MSTEQTPNPPAFPNNEQCSDSYGMTLRDHFAGLAMQGHISSQYGVAVHCDDSNREALAECFYKMADEMLKERVRNHLNS